MTRLLQELHPAMPNAIHHGLRAIAETLDLRTRTIQVAVMEEPVQSAKHLLLAATRQIHYLNRAKKSIVENIFDDVQITVCKLWRWCGWRSVEAWMAKCCHHQILP
jgi:hypothetical protein